MVNDVKGGIAGEDVREWHELDPDRVQRRRDAWSAPASLTRQELPPREVRSYQVGGGLVGEILETGAAGLDRRRPHIARIEGVLTSSIERLSRAEALDAFILETRPGKFLEALEPELGMLDSEREYTSLDLQTRLEAHVEAHRWWRELDPRKLAYLGGLLGLILGPLEAVKLWRRFWGDEAPDIFWLLAGCDDPTEELHLDAFLHGEFTRLESPAWTAWHAGAVRRLADEELAVRVVCERPDLLGVEGADRDMFRLARDSEGFVRRFCEELAVLDEGSLELLAAHDALERVVGLIPGIPNYKKVSQKRGAMSALAKVHARWLVEPMLELLGADKIDGAARAWILTEGANAVVGLVGCIDASTPRGQVCVEFLRLYRDNGHGELVGELTRAHGDPERADLVRDLVLEHYTARKQSIAPDELPGWLLGLIGDKNLRRRSLPKFIDLGALPRLQTRDGEVVGLEVSEVLVRVVKASTFADENCGIEELRAWLDPVSAQSFAHALTSAWMSAGAKVTYVWVLRAIGFFGDLHSAKVLEEPMKAWRLEWSSSKGKLYQAGCDVLEHLFERGFATGLGLLVELQERSRGHASWHNEGVTIAAIAKRRGVFLKEVQVMSVPEFGFNARGEREFDYGARRFMLRLDEELRVSFVSSRGEVLAMLPRAASGDDPEKVDRARQEYSRDRELLLETLELERAYFARMMKLGRTWSVKTWERYVRAHPLVKNFARRLLWIGASSRGQEKVVFRVTEVFDLADAEDELVELREKGRVRLVKRGELVGAELRAWQEIFADYEIIQPFEQLS